MPLKLQTGRAYLLPASTSFAAPRPLPRYFLPVIRFNPPTDRIWNWAQVKFTKDITPPRLLRSRVPLAWLIHRLKGWSKVNIIKIVKHDRDANAPTACTPGGVVEVPRELAARCRYRGEMMMIENRACAVFVDPDFICRYAQPMP